MVKKLKGIIRKPARPVSIEDMNEAIAQATVRNGVVTWPNDAELAPDAMLDRMREALSKPVLHEAEFDAGRKAAKRLADLGGTQPGIEGAPRRTLASSPWRRRKKKGG